MVYFITVAINHLITLIRTLESLHHIKNCRKLKNYYFLEIIVHIITVRLVVTFNRENITAPWNYWTKPIEISTLGHQSSKYHNIRVLISINTIYINFYKLTIHIFWTIQVTYIIFTLEIILIIISFNYIP